MAETDISLKLGLDTSEVTKQTKQMQAKVQKALDSGSESKFLRKYSNAVDKLNNKLEKLQAKQDKIAKTSIAPDGYKEAERALNSLNKQEDKLLERMRMFKAGLSEADQSKSTYALAADYKQYGNMVQQLESVQDKIEETREDLRLMEADFIQGTDTTEYSALEREIEGVQRQIIDLNTVADSEIGTLTQKLKALGAGVMSFGKQYTSWFEKIISTVRNATKAHQEFSASSNGAGLNAKKLFTTLLKYGLGIRSFYFLFRKLRSAITDGFKQLAQESPAVNAQISTLASGLAQLKNSLATAFQPILAAVVPILSTLIGWLNTATAAIANFIAVLTGQSVIYKAAKVTKDFAKELKGAGGSAGKAGKEVKKAFADFDEINVIDLHKDDSSGGGGGGAGADSQFVEQEAAASAFAEKIKDIMSRLFAPLKAAWDTYGESVMIAWKYALEQIKALIISIGQDFLTVWQQPATVTIFENLLKIITDIGLVVGNLARGFREAWEENETGLHILENIRDIIGDIVQHATNMADFTVTWSANMDFGPLLTSFQRFTKNIRPMVDGIGGIVEDMYTKYLLPIISWIVEDGIPQVLDIFGRLGTEIDWETLRENLSTVWENLEKFTENVGQGLINFINDMVTGVTNLVNSKWFQQFLVDISDALANISPEEVEALAKSFTLLYLAFKLFEGLSIIYTLGATLAGWGTLFIGLGLIVTSFADMWVSGFTDMNVAIMSLGIAIGVVSLIILGVPGAIAVVIGAVLALVVLLVVGLKHHWQEIKDQIKELRDNIKEKWDHIKDNAKETWDGVKQTVKDNVQKLKDDAIALFTKLKDKVHEIWTNLKNKTQELWTSLKNWLNEKWTAIKETASELFTKLKEKLSEIWDKVKEKVHEVWDGIKQWLTEKIDNIKQSVTDKFETIKKTISDIHDTIKKKVTDAWNGMWSGMKGAINNILAGVEKFANGVVDAVNKVIDALNSFVDIDIDVPEWAEDLTGIGDLHIGLNIPNLNHVSIPRLAQGAVLPPNEPFLAMLGDQRSGTNVEAPLDTIKQALVEAMSEVSNVNNNQPIVINFTGNLAALARTLKPELDRESSRRGGSLVVRSGVV